MRRRWYWSGLFLSLAVGAILAFVGLLRIPAERGPWLGVSAARAAALLGLAGLAILHGTLALFFYRRPERAHFLAQHAQRIRFGLATSFVGGVLTLLLTRQYLPFSFYERLFPILSYLTAGAFLSWLWLISPLHSHLKSDWPGKAFLLTAIFVFSLVGWIAYSRMGLTRDTAYWAEPGIPITEAQLLAALLIGIMFLPLQEAKVAPILTGLGLWVLAVILWWLPPMQVMQSSFYAPMTAPHFAPYPYSDAAFYDSLAQSLLIGEGYLGRIPPRPLYVVFLAALHLLFGQNYSHILLAQTLVLGVIPPAFYLLARRLGSPAAGIGIALLAIFREWNSLWLSSVTRVSNTRTLMTDLPTLLVLLLVAWSVLRWLERPEASRSIWSGGLFGLLLLLRTQSLLLLPFLLLLSFLEHRSRLYWRMLLLFLAGMGAVILPWLLHNYIQSGFLAFDDPSQLGLLASQYSDRPLNPTPIHQNPLWFLLTRLIQEPGAVLGAVLNHTFATLIGGFLILPFQNVLVQGRYDLDWAERLSFQGTDRLLMIGYLLLFAFGLAAAWQRNRWRGLLPLFLTFGYALSNGVARFSGWRYNLPADWVGYFYLILGAIEGMQRLHFPITLPASVRISAFPLDLRQIAPALIILLAWGFLPWIAQEIVPSRYPSALSTPDAARQTLLNLGLPEQQTEKVLQRLEWQEGRLLYPRFFYKGIGLTGTNPWPAYTPQDYPRLGFVLLHRASWQVIFPVRQASVFPSQGAEVLIFGCKQADHFRAILLAVPQEGLLLRSDLPEWSCP